MIKNTAYLIIPILLISLYGGCSDNGNSDNMNCFPNEEIMNSECLAEDLINICDQFFCGAEFPTDDPDIILAGDFFFPPGDQECISVDCSTLDCGSSGFFSNIEIGVNVMPTGLISSNPEVDFICFITSNDHK